MGFDPTLIFWQAIKQLEPMEEPRRSPRALLSRKAR
jgi:hypothetical protein